MSSTVGTVDPSVIYQLISRAIKGIFFCNDSFLQSGCHCNDLKGRTRFISIIQAWISPHLVQQILLFLLAKGRCILFRIQFKRLVQIKFRHIYTGIDFTVLRIHQKDGDPVRLFFLHHLLCRLLHIFLDAGIQTDPKILPCHRFLSFFSFICKFHSPGICNRQNFPIFSP